MNVEIHLIVLMLCTYYINGSVYYQMYIIILFIFICCYLSWPAYLVLNLWLVHYGFHKQNQISNRFVSEKLKQQ